MNETAGNALVATFGANAVFFKCNVAEYDDQVHVFTRVWEKWGRLDALLANAGHSDRGSIYLLNHRGNKEVPSKPAFLSTDVCYKGFLYGVQLAIHFMRQNATPGGQIIATSSIASIHPHHTFPEYNGAKAAVSPPNIYLLFSADANDNLSDQHVRTHSSAGVAVGKNSPARQKRNDTVILTR